VPGSAGVETNKLYENRQQLETWWFRYVLDYRLALLNNRGINIMEIGETIYVTTREEFREWLEKNHKIKKEIWLIQYKKFTQKPSIPYVDAVEEAICFGWIDGFEKGMDDQRYAKRFTPRRQKSLWTETNIERARKMIEEGKMTEAGRAVLPKGI